MINWNLMWTIALAIFIGQFIRNVLSGIFRAITQEFIEQAKRIKKTKAKSEGEE